MSPALSRADLLRLLAVAPPTGQAGAAAVLGWARQDPQPGVPSGPVAATPAPPGRVPALDGGELQYLARRRPYYWRVEQSRPEPASEQDAQVEPDDPAEAAAGSDQLPPPQDQPIPPLRSAGQWQNLWDRLPPHPAGGGRIDLRRCVAKLARAEPLQRLPRQPRAGFSRALTLILDRPDALRPVWDDMGAARRSLSALFGDELLGFHLPGGPDGAWHRLGRPGLASRTAIPGGATVVLIGAFGALQTGTPSPPWRALLAQLRDNGHDCLLVPVCPLRAAALPATPGSRLAALDPAAGRGAGPVPAAKALDTLLAALSHLWLPAPARLRGLRRAVPGAGLHTELLAYNHPTVVHNEFHLGLRAEHLLEALHRFDALDPALRRTLQARIDAWPLDAGARDIERLQGRLLDPGAAAAYPQLLRQGRQAVADLSRPSMALGQFCAMLPLLRQLEARGPGADWRPTLDAAHQVARALHRLPEAEQRHRASAGLVLRQRGQGLVAQPAGPDVAGLLAVGPGAWCAQTGQWASAGLPTGSRTVELIDRGLRWRLQAGPRPAWAQRAWVDGGRLYAAHAQGARFEWAPASPTRPSGGWEPLEPGQGADWDWAAAVGVDQHGLWALLRVGEAGYRLRWVPPGEFLMGSPADEDERDDGETLHRVRLTRGYWLGETAVTQALWQAVTGNNPSSHKGDRLPVEQVSWDDCQDFIEQLNRKLPGLHADLPTEAQWEYACRAGTRTRYWWEDLFDAEYANSGGQTRPDADYPANGFGLRGMSGNVYEWCADGFREYPDGPVDDPVGPPEAGRRVLRGGSWGHFGRYLRSAYRYHNSPDYRGAYFGLRLAGGFDPRAGQPGAGAATADGREQGERQGGGRGHGDGASASPPAGQRSTRKSGFGRLTGRDRD